jgi:pimeloyl-ACP methyl ester carboxylesterase
MILEDWKRAGKDFSHHGHRVFYRDEGRGPVLVCIHGFPTSSWDWHRVWPDLIKRFRVIAADMIGFGLSDKPKDYAYSIHDQATLHERLLQGLGVRHIHILAHDYGDTVAQELLARSEDRRRDGVGGIEIASVCFLNGGLFPETHRPRLIQKLLLSPVGFLVGRLVSEAAFRRSFSAIFGQNTRPSDEELRDFWSLITFNDGTAVAHKIIHYMRERRHHRARWVGVLLTTKVPLRLINGPADPVSGAHAAARYRELVPSPDVVLLDGIGHYPQIEDPSGVTDAFLAFVSEDS